MFGSRLDVERAFGTIPIVSRTRVRYRRLTVGACLALVGAAWTGPAVRALGPSGEPIRVARTSYVIQEGDTLWSIARRLAPAEDPRAVVDALARANDIDAGELVPGQALALPAGS